MARAGLDKDIVIRKAAELANETGFENLSLKTLAKELNIKSPSLYNHIGSLEELKQELMLYGWKQLEVVILGAVSEVSGYEAIVLLLLLNGQFCNYDFFS